MDGRSVRPSSESSSRSSSSLHLMLQCWCGSPVRGFSTRGRLHPFLAHGSETRASAIEMLEIVMVNVELFFDIPLFIYLYDALILSNLTITQRIGVVSSKCSVCIGSGRARDEGWGDRWELGRLAVRGGGFRNVHCDSV